MSILETERLLLRHPERRDISAFVPLIADFDVSKNLANVPHPYAEKDAHDWIKRLEERRSKGEGHQFGVTRRSDGAYMGGCGLHTHNGELELGYWYGKPYWKQGYATEAALCVLRFAFEELKASEVWAGWFHDNPNSGRVLEKLGFKSKGFEPRSCMARGMDVGCNIVTITREAFAGRRPS